MGESLMVITSVAGTISIGRPRCECRASSCLTRPRAADQQDAHAKLARRQHRAFDFGPGRMVASHGIHSDGDHSYACR